MFFLACFLIFKITCEARIGWKIRNKGIISKDKGPCESNAKLMISIDWHT